MATNKTYKGLEVFDVILTGETDGVNCVSFVDEPAMMSYFITLSEEQEVIYLSRDDEQQILLGAVLIPDRLVYRRNATKGYYIKFTKEVIEEMKDRFHKNQYTSVTNENHNKPLDRNYVVDSYLLSEDLQDNRFPNLPIGTWILGYKVEDTEYWNNSIKTGKVKGFSIEANADITLKLELDIMEKESTIERSLVNRLRVFLGLDLAAEVSIEDLMQLLDEKNTIIENQLLEIEAANVAINTLNESHTTAYNTISSLLTELICFKQLADEQSIFIQTHISKLQETSTEEELTIEEVFEVEIPLNLRKTESSKVIGATSSNDLVRYIRDTKNNSK